MLSKIFSPPAFPEDEEKKQTAYYLNVIALSNIPIIILFIIIRTVDGNQLFGSENLIVMTTIPVLLAAWFLSKRGLVNLAANLYVAVFWIVSTLYGLSTAGIRGSTFASYFVTMLMAGLLLGWRQVLLYTFLSIVAAFGMALSENLGVTPYTPKSAFGISVEGAVLFIFGGIFLYLIINSLQTAIKREKANATALQSTNQYLTELRDTLEKRVEERTKEIEAEQARALRRSRQFEGIARVSKAISKTRNLQEVLPQIAQVISEQFDFYHVGIFLNDAVNQYAILSAANSEGGKRMLDRGHQLKIGEQGIVGFVTGSGNPRIALDVGADNVYFNNPDLPLTHSEMALPLKSGNEIIGALDIQSIEQNAFSDDDVEVLVSLADQVSLAIQNTRLFDQTTKLLSEAEAIQKQYQKSTWGRLSREKKLTGYKYTITGAVPLDEAETELSQRDHSKREVAVPISLRGENIGTLIVQLPYSERVNADQMDLIKAVAERVALSAENARLFEETNRRAEREQVISDIAAKISTSVHTENILKTTARELNQILNGAEVLIKLGTDRNQ